VSLARYIARRFILLLVLLWGATVITFVVTNLVPADPVAIQLGQTAMSDPEIVAAFKARYGLDRPLPEQYWRYLTNLLKGDLGRSIRTGRPVLDDLARYFPASFELATVATLISVVAGVAAGVASAVWRGRAIDSLVRVGAMIGVSVPNFWLALLALYVFYFRLRWLPGPGRVSALTQLPDGTGLLILDSILHGDWALLKEVLRHLVLPSLVLGSYTMGVIARTTRSSMLEVMGADYIRTARAKGVGERAVVFRHALANAMIPTVTMIGLSYGNLLGGTVLVETIFSWPGIGRYAYQSTTTLDFPAIMGVTLLITAVYAVINMLVDIAYGLLDPRIRYG